MKKIWIANAALTLLGFAAQASAVPITSFSSEAAYFAAAGPQTTLDFSNQSGTLPANLFAASGVTLDGNDSAVGQATAGNGRFDMSFSAHHKAVGFEFPGALKIDLYDGTTLLGSSDNFGGFGSGFFGGVTTLAGFNRIVLHDVVDDLAFIQTMFLGPPTLAVPEPGSVSVIALGLLAVAAGRRRAQSR